MAAISAPAFGVPIKEHEQAPLVLTSGTLLSEAETSAERSLSHSLGLGGGGTIAPDGRANASTNRKIQ